MNPRLALILLLSAPALVLGANGQPQPGRDTVRLQVTRDTWLSSVKDERDANLGGSERLKTKGIQEFSIVDLDPTPLRGRVITGVTLHLRKVDGEPLRRTTVSSLSTDWVEGTSTRYRPQVGSASFNWAAQDRQPWAWPGSDVTAVMNGLGSTLWASIDATSPDDENWQEIAVDPAVIAARVAGLSSGFVVFDDIGSEYRRDGDRVELLPMRNRFHASREEGEDSAPYFIVQLGQADHDGPKVVTEIRTTTRAIHESPLQAGEEIRPGEALVDWVTPADVGPAGTLGFQVRIAAGTFSWDSATPLPRYLVPLAGKPGERVTMHLRDHDSPPGQPVTVGIRAVDRAGNAGPVQTALVKLATPLPELVLPAPPPLPVAGPGDRLPTIGGLQLFVVDGLDKVDPYSGAMIPPQEDSYRLTNHLWSAARKEVRLYAARNETVNFQLVAQGASPGLRAAVSFTGSDKVQPQSALLAFRYVKGSDGRMYPDPLVPHDAPLPVPFPDERLAGQTHASLLAEIHVPKTARPGRHHGTLTVTSGGEKLDIAITLQVWDFALPDQLSFIPQLNGYGRVPEPDQELAYYRLAHQHRTCLNILPYGWTGKIADGRAPGWNGKDFDWSAYDRRFGPLLDGSAFVGLPRGPVPVEAFYLPFNENWPIGISGAFLGGYWVDAALKPDYRRNFVNAVKKFGEHVRDKGWNRTMFEFYLNNKVTHKKASWGRSSAPWNFDEPVNTQDFQALRWYGQAFREGVGEKQPAANLLFRADISRPQWQRDMLDGILNVNVVGGEYRRYQRLVLDRKAKGDQITYNYGSVNRIEQSNLQPVVWCLEAWVNGLDGVIPWQSLGRKRSWEETDELALIYPGSAIGRTGPLASIRLKALQRGQQDVEYLTILATETGLPRWMKGNMIMQKLCLGSEFAQDFKEQ